MECCFDVERYCDTCGADIDFDNDDPAAVYTVYDELICGWCREDRRVRAY